MTIDERPVDTADATLAFVCRLVEEVADVEPLVVGEDRLVVVRRRPRQHTIVRCLIGRITLGIMEREIKRVKNGRYYEIPASIETRGHGTSGEAKWWKQLLPEMLSEATAPGQ